jgi:AbrB family looped-hinge helix DNA binding protein
MARTADDLTVRVGPQGRIVIPAGMRRELALGEGTLLIPRIEDGRLVFERRADILRRLRRNFAAVEPGVRLSEELIADRRKEAERERKE